MNIAILSDQHGSLPPIPKCDLLIISGDITGGPDYVEGKWRPDLSDSKHHWWLKTKFNDWISSAPVAVVIAGNHDTCVERFGFPTIPNVTYLEDSGCDLLGLHVWGTPWTRRYDNLAFNDDELKLLDRWSSIPHGVDILVCHMPPLGIGDRVNGIPVGSTSLLTTIQRVKPRLVICGHIHEGRGIYNLDGVKIVNSACAFTEVSL